MNSVIQTKELQLSKYNMTEKIFTLSDFNYFLPENLIASYPSEKRGESRLFLIDKSAGTFMHDSFFNISNYIRKDDLLVLNNAKVVNARIFFKRKTGARVEVVLTEKINDSLWKIISNRSKRIELKEILISEKKPDILFEIVERIEDGFIVKSDKPLTADLLLEIGEVPLPPYIKRIPEKSDVERYQTVYAADGTAVAAPTAGLHFTDSIIDQIKGKGADIVFLTLDVSWGTFQPVRDEDLSAHKIHIEKYFLSEEAAIKINKSRAEKRRIISVGTTSLRVLESTFNGNENIPGCGETEIFIMPPYKIKSADALITNFHTPKSTLLMLVSAFAGYDLIKSAYKEAVTEKYRFYSYGDSMFIF